MKVLLIFVASLMLVSCGSKKSGNANGGSNGGGSGGGSSPTEPPPTVPLPTNPLPTTVSITTDLEDITAANASNFMLSGSCSEEGQPITVVVVVGEGEEDLSPETAPTCTNGSWMAEVDLSSLTGPSKVIAITADHASSGGQNATQATGTVLFPPRVSIASQLLEDITSFNSQAFSVSGTCSEEGEDVTVSVGTINATPTCATGGTWGLEIDLSSLTGDSVTTSITVDHSTSSDLSALQATASVTLNPPVSINTVALGNITAANAASFAVSGGCSDNGQPVTVRVGGVSPTTNPNCTTGAWSITVDVTGLNKTEGEVSITVDHSPASGSAYPQATTSVTNDFVCPTNYVGVPALSTYTTNSFCVMKYEAKSDGSDTDGDDTDDNNATSQATGLPYVSIDRADSIAKCTGIGEGYDLITNDEWQSIARNIELVGDNWSTGVVGNAGGLSRGHSDSTPAVSLAAISDDTKGCEGTGQTCSNTTWDDQRRTHTLSNGEVTWDIAGNVWEWVKDNNGSIYNVDASFSQVTAVTNPSSNSLSGGTTTTARNAKAQFGPSGNYVSLNTNPYGNLGYGWLNYSAGGVFRGGYRANREAAGVFAVNLFNVPTYTIMTIGFRCVFHP